MFVVVLFMLPNLYLDRFESHKGTLVSWMGTFVVLAEVGSNR